MLETPDDEPDHDAIWERVLVDPAYREFWKAQVGAELEQAIPLTCGDCGSVILQDRHGDDYCPTCEAWMA